jgi:phage-related minor tail protein
MALNQATLELLIQLKDQASSGLDSLGGAMGNVGMIAGGAALAGVAALGAAIVSGAQDAQASRALMAETTEIIKNTGDAAGVSAQDVADLASSLSDAAGASLFGDDQIQGAENVLLRFKDLQIDMDSLTQTAVDMAQTLGTAPADAAQKLGLALQDPFNAEAKLAKQGILLNEQQAEMLYAFKDAGDEAGAHADGVAPQGRC